MPKHSQDKAEELFVRAMIATKKELQNIKTKRLPKLEEELNDVALSIITRWYASYEPLIYRRQMSLKKAFKVFVNTQEQKMIFDYKYMDEAGFSHHQSNEIIYNNAFLSGYHGGSYGDGISSSLLYWRTPVPQYTEWGHPAIHTFSPYKLIEEEAHYIIEKENNRNMKELKLHLDAAKKNLKKYLGVS